MIGAFQLLCHVVMIALHSDAFPLFPEYAVSTRIPKIYRLMKVIVNNFNKKQKGITKKEPFAYLHRNFQFQECICKLGQKWFALRWKFLIFDLNNNKKNFNHQVQIKITKSLILILFARLCFNWSASRRFVISGWKSTGEVSPQVFEMKSMTFSRDLFMRKFKSPQRKMKS